MIDAVEKAQLLELIDECRKRGVLRIALRSPRADVEVTLAPQLPEASTLFPELSEKTTDPNKCSKCQVLPPDGRIKGMCKLCSMREAGVATS